MIKRIGNPLTASNARSEEQFSVVAGTRPPNKVATCIYRSGNLLDLERVEETQFGDRNTKYI